MYFTHPTHLPGGVWCILRVRGFSPERALHTHTPYVYTKRKSFSFLFFVHFLLFSFAENRPTHPTPRLHTHIELPARKAQAIHIRIMHEKKYPLSRIPSEKNTPYSGKSLLFGGLLARESSCKIGVTSYFF